MECTQIAFYVDVSRWNQYDMQSDLAVTISFLVLPNLA